MPQCLKCSSEFPNHVMIEGKKRNLQNRQYCLECSPFGKHNTTKIHEIKIRKISPDFRCCPRCSQFLAKEQFYSRRGIKFSSVYCKSCTSDQTLERQRKFKKKCVDYKGGKCEICDYDKCIGALEFHHKDPTQKDFTIAHRRLWSFDEAVKVELDKCSLLCANCHREEHYKQIQTKHSGRDSNPRLAN